MQKEFYCLDELNGLCGNLRISLKGLRKKAQLIMCLKHNTQQTLTGALGVRDSLCSWGREAPLSSAEAFRISHASLGMGRGWDFLLH